MRQNLHSGDKKRVLVTGAGKRLGAAIARSLGLDGYDVVVHYAGSVSGADATVSIIQKADGSAVAIQADLLERDAPEKLISRAAEALGGPLTVLVNNASIFEDDTLMTMTQESWDRHMVSNLRAPVFLSQAFAAQCPKGQSDEYGEPMASGVIVNIIDQRVRKLTPTFFTYTLAKASLWTFTKTAAQALAPDVRVNAIGPGPTLQGERQAIVDFKKQRQSTILERGSNPEDIISALKFILSNPAFTGQLLCVDGGQHLIWKTPDVLVSE